MFSSEKIRSDSVEIRTKFVRISSEFHNASILTHIHSRDIGMKFLRISCEFGTDFTRFPRNLVT